MATNPGRYEQTVEAIKRTERIWRNKLKGARKQVGELSKVLADQTSGTLETKMTTMEMGATKVGNV